MMNEDLAAMFEEIAYMIQAEGNDKSRFEANAYLRSARALRSLNEDVEDIYRRGGIEALTSIEGIGKKIASYIEEYIRTGKIGKYDDLKKKYPIDFRGLSKVQGLGPRKIASLYKYAGVKDLDDLKKALSEHRIASIPGFGDKSEREIADNLQIAEMSYRRIPLPQGYRIAMDIVEEIRRAPGTLNVSVAGSIRRMRDTVGDIDILCVTDDPASAIDAFTRSRHCVRVISSGEKKSTIATDADVTCDLRIIDRASFGSTLQYFTGSKDHNIKLRKIAIDRGLKLNEYGLYRDDRNLVENQGEERIYAELGMQYIQPEMREDRGEIDLAISSKLPNVMGYGDVIGDFYIPYDFAMSYGVKEIKKMTGYGYIGVVAKDQSISEFMKDIKSMEGVLVGVEISGKQDPDRMAHATFDFTVLDLSESSNTADACSTIESMRPTFIRNPTGRRFGGDRIRNLSDIVKSAKKAGSIIMITATDLAFDPIAEDIISCRDEVTYALGSFSEKPEGIADIRYGVGISRRAGLPKNRILNTFSYDDVMKAISGH
ncbi:helix-hairpin-helix domain-containing protein [Thermoplasma sp.]|uniref:helix-hairpin-helix domain-containing protein n=1 Tax=Thermoplasma sp. TaxID=1973142 RepID=UPI0012758BA5|nr:helix-hairpin-helix domain-containing protein [Thermoplasma sp.]KAA8922188.1 MAG: hypothetical protein F6Q11_05505 [Thermoplasma sp.]